MKQVSGSVYLLNILLKKILFLKNKNNGKKNMVTFNKNNETLLLLIIPSLKQVLMCLKLFFSLPVGENRKEE